MIIQEMSDLHLEMHADKGNSFIKSLNSTGVDVLVLAGDIVSFFNRQAAEAALIAFCEKFKQIVYVSGNHEYYGTLPDHTIECIKLVAAKTGNLHFLNNSEVTIDGQRFIGGTGWFPHNIYAEDAEKYMNDFNMIVGFRDWVYRQNLEFLCFAAGSMAETDVVITHHLPSIKCIHPKYTMDALNPFFLGEFDDLILDYKPKLWIHGHTHQQLDFKIGPTRIVCNPLGYPVDGGSLNAFQDRFLIEV